MHPVENPAAQPECHLTPQPDGMKHRFHAMVKPIGSVCNLDCTYCYYLHKEELLHQPKAPRMSDEMLEQHIRQYIEAQTGDQVVFSWQGGEPTLLGLPFFRKVVELEAKYQKPGQRIENDLQTNGTLLDDDWAAFLKEHNFLVGLSCDGPKDLHDHYRVTKGGQPTHDKVMAAARLLHAHEVPFAALCVVNRVNAKRPRDVYRFLTRELGAWRIQLYSVTTPLYLGLILAAIPKYTKGKLPLVAKNKAGKPLTSKVEALEDPRTDTPYLLPPPGTTDKDSIATGTGKEATHEIKEWQAIMDHLRRLPAEKGKLPVIPVDDRAAEVRAIKAG